MTYRLTCMENPKQLLVGEDTKLGKRVYAPLPQASPPEGVALSFPSAVLHALAPGGAVPGLSPLPADWRMFLPAGAVHYVATAGGTRDFAKGLRSGGGVVATMSSVNPGCSETFLLSRFEGQPNRRSMTNRTRNSAQSWAAVDLGPHNRLVPEAYALLSDNWATGKEKLRHWRLEGSNDGVSWVLLREHCDDERCDEQSHLACWEVGSANAGSGLGFRAFRVLQTGLNSGQAPNHHLHCEGIELYGLLGGIELEGGRIGLAVPCAEDTAVEEGGVATADEPASSMVAAAAGVAPPAVPSVAAPVAALVTALEETSIDAAAHSSNSNSNSSSSSSSDEHDEH